MNTISPYFALLIYLVAFISAWLIVKFFKTEEHTYRNKTIDGLRGFLAIGVFIHHSVVWYYYLQSGKWENPTSNLYSHLGQSSVSFFFMITAYLFISKLIASSEKTFDWKQFFISRIYRLAPMYYLAMSFVFIIAMHISGWRLRVTPFEFLTSIFHWGVFTFTRMVDINNQEQTLMIGGGVVWSLPWEWLFYFSLPLMAMFLLKNKPPTMLLLLSLLIVVAYFTAHGLKFTHIYSFMGGAVAPVLIKLNVKIKNIKHYQWSLLIVLCFIILLQFNSSENILIKTLIVVIFTIIALGNTFFGLLEHKYLKLLGDISYSTYLLHSLLLFCFFNFVFTPTVIQNKTKTEYEIFILILTPFLILMSYLGFRFIEKPFMESIKKKIPKTN